MYYPINGNAFEWCFTEGGSYRASCSGSWMSIEELMQRGGVRISYLYDVYYDINFRPCRTAD